MNSLKSYIKKIQLKEQELSTEIHKLVGLFQFNTKFRGVDSPEVGLYYDVTNNRYFYITNGQFDGLVDFGKYEDHREAFNTFLSDYKSGMPEILSTYKDSKQEKPALAIRALLDVNSPISLQSSHTPIVGDKFEWNGKVYEIECISSPIDPNPIKFIGGFAVSHDALSQFKLLTNESIKPSFVMIKKDNEEDIIEKLNEDKELQKTKSKSDIKWYKNHKDLIAHLEDDNLYVHESYMKSKLYGMIHMHESKLNEAFNMKMVHVTHMVPGKSPGIKGDVVVIRNEHESIEKMIQLLGLDRNGKPKKVGEAYIVYSDENKNVSFYEEESDIPKAD